MIKPSTAQLLTSLTLLLSIVAIAQFVEGNTNEEPELEIHNLFKPEVCDRKIKVTDLVTLHYKGTLQSNGKEFDSSYGRNQPFQFQIGIGQVILGWEKGLLNACVGEKLKLVIPPHLAYGDAPQEAIPPKSTLVFEVEILKIEDGPKPVNVFKEIDADNDGKLTRKEVGDFLKKQLQQSQRHGDAGSMDDPEQAQMVDEIFMHEDKDKDNFITHEEFSGPKTDHDEL